MDKLKLTVVIIGAGTIAILGISVLTYYYAGCRSRANRLKIVECKGSKTKDGEDDDDDEDDKTKVGLEEKTVELEELQLEQLSNYKVLSDGEIDAAQFTSSDGHQHDVLIQYCADTPTTIANLDHRSLGKAFGRVELDDASVAIVYRGSAEAVLFTSNTVDHLDRFMAVQALLHALSRVLLVARKEGFLVPEETLRNSVIIINSASKIRLLGLHSFVYDKSAEGDETQLEAFLAIAIDLLRQVELDKSPAEKLIKDLQDNHYTLEQIEKKLK